MIKYAGLILKLGFPYILYVWFFYHIYVVDATEQGKPNGFTFRSKYRDKSTLEGSKDLCSTRNLYRYHPYDHVNSTSKDKSFINTFNNSDSLRILESNETINIEPNSIVFNDLNNEDGSRNVTGKRNNEYQIINEAESVDNKNIFVCENLLNDQSSNICENVNNLNDDFLNHLDQFFISEEINSYEDFIEHMFGDNFLSMNNKNSQDFVEWINNTDTEKRIPWLENIIESECDNSVATVENTPRYNIQLPDEFELKELCPLLCVTNNKNSLNNNASTSSSSSEIRFSIYPKETSKAETEYNISFNGILMSFIMPICEVMKLKNTTEINSELILDNIEDVKKVIGPLFPKKCLYRKPIREQFPKETCIIIKDLCKLEPFFPKHTSYDIVINILDSPILFKIYLLLTSSYSNSYGQKMEKNFESRLHNKEICFKSMPNIEILLKMESHILGKQLESLKFGIMDDNQVYHVKDFFKMVYHMYIGIDPSEQRLFDEPMLILHKHIKTILTQFRKDYNPVQSLKLKTLHDVAYLVDRHEKKGFITYVIHLLSIVEKTQEELKKYIINSLKDNSVMVFFILHRIIGLMILQLYLAPVKSQELKENFTSFSHFMEIYQNTFSTVTTVECFNKLTEYQKSLLSYNDNASYAIILYLHLQVARVYLKRINCLYKKINNLLKNKAKTGGVSAKEKVWEAKVAYVCSLDYLQKIGEFYEYHTKVKKTLQKNLHGFVMENRINAKINLLLKLSEEWSYRNKTEADNQYFREIYNEILSMFSQYKAHCEKYY